jgi:hypothetical protein
MSCTKYINEYMERKVESKDGKMKMGCFEIRYTLFKSLFVVKIKYGKLASRISVKESQRVLINWNILLIQYAL